MRVSKTTRRRFLFGAILAAPFLAIADAKYLEPGWVKTRRVRLAPGKPTHRLVHLTDIHHKGDRAYLLSVVRKVNALSPDFICFTGDLIEDGRHLPEALELLAGLKSPVYGVPGNHDFWSKVPFEGITKCFRATGGDWLLEQQTVTRDGKFTLSGAAWLSDKHPPLLPRSNTRNLFLMHYPVWVEKLAGRQFDLILAGHSHGGQVRLPFYGPIYLPFGVAQYDLGLFRTASGPLYVNPGLGWFPYPVRFNCRPEITVFEL